ncbi:hypothetical protein [Sulfuricaulis sp.]|uniref:hypothetical protein n=1 Tax=Sulfuricaulis sp. TaxID=2003553 RepID=UPI00355A5745
MRSTFDPPLSPAARSKKESSSAREAIRRAVMLWCRFHTSRANGLQGGVRLSEPAERRLMSVHRHTGREPHGEIARVDGVARNHLE